MKPTIQRVDTWDLVVRSTKAGVVGMSHRLRFANQPTLQDFLDVCKLLPWTSVWDDTLLAILPECDWPVVGSGYKANHTIIHTQSGDYEITVQRSEVWRN